MRECIVSQTKNLTQIQILLILSVFITSGCNVSGLNNQVEISQTSATQKFVHTPQSSGQPTSSVQACKPTIPQEMPPENPYTTIIEDFDLKVSSGNMIYGLIRRPDPARYSVPPHLP